MSNKLTLDDIKANIEKKYAPLVFEVNGQEYTLVSLMRVNRKVRDAVQDRLESMGGKPDENGDISIDSSVNDEDKLIDSLQFILSSVTKDGRGTQLVNALPKDILVLMEIMREWQEATQPGEASNSPN